MRILYIHQYAFGSSVPGFTRPIELMAELVKRGHNAFMISGFFSHITRRRAPQYRKKYLFCRENILGVAIYRVSGLLNLTSRFYKLIHHTCFLFLAICQGIAIPTVDVVIASSPSPFALIAGYVVSRLRRVPLVL